MALGEPGSQGHSINVKLLSAMFNHSYEAKIIIHLNRQSSECVKKKENHKELTCLVCSLVQVSHLMFVSQATLIPLDGDHLTF